MTDRELAVKLVKEGIEVFRVVNEETLAVEVNNLTVSLMPVLLMACIQTVIQIHAARCEARIRIVEMP